jgi:hypothetical protein
LGGDWKQLMPVVPGGSINHQYVASVKNSHLFKYFTTRRLKQNQRLEPGQQAYRDFILSIGRGTRNDAEDRVKLPEGMCVRSRRELIDFVFPSHILQNPEAHWEELGGCAILSPINAGTFEFNNMIMVILFLKYFFQLSLYYY